MGASEREEFLRAAWRALVCARQDGRRFVFVEACSTNTSLSPIYGWSGRGQRLYFEAPRNWGANVTLLSSMSLEGMGPSLAVEGPTTKAVLEAYVEHVLAPALKPGQIVVMDNLSSHKGSRVREIIEGRGCKLLYLPPYSPELNPIEEAFAKLKALFCARLRRAPEKPCWKQWVERLML